MSAARKKGPDPGNGVGLELIERIRAALTGEARLRLLEPHAAAWCETLDSLESRARDEVAVLVVLILGGTGVGKSTLINALVGRPVAITSRVRPCTQHFTLYGPAQLERGFLPAPDLPFVHIPAAAQEPLEHVLLIDAPDCDSIEPENRRRLEQLLPVADLLITVGTQAAGKYKIEALYELIRSLRDRKRFIFVYNQRDGESAEAAARVVEDWRHSLGCEGFAGPRIFRFNAKSVWEARRSSQVISAADGDFAELREWIFARLTAADAQLIKRGNIAGDLRHLVSEMAAAAERRAPQLAAAQQYLDEAAAGLAQRWVQRVRERVRLRWRSIFRRRIFSILAQESTGLFGAAARLAAFCGLIGLLPLQLLRLARGRWGAASSVARESHRLWRRWREAAQGDLGEFEDLLPVSHRQAQEAQRVLSHYMREAGLTADVPQGATPQDPAAPGLLADFARHWEQWIAEAIDRHRLWLCNVPVQALLNASPLALVGWATWTAVTRFWSGQYLPLDYYLNVLFLLVLVLGAELWAFRAIASRGAHLMINRRLGKLELVLAGLFFPSARLALSRAQREIAALRDLAQEVSGRIAHDIGMDIGPSVRGSLPAERTGD